MKKMPVFQAMFFVIAVSLSGCVKTKVLQPSGFLGDVSIYKSMRPDPEILGMRIYKTVRYPLAGYDSFIVPPVTIYLNSEGNQKDISDRDLKNLGENFRRDVIDAIGDRYQVVGSPSARVAILRLAITDVDPNNAFMNLLPPTQLLGGGLGGASMEAALVDSVSGELIAAVMASGKEQEFSYTEGLTKWASVDSVFKQWAAILERRIERSHGYAE